MLITKQSIITGFIHTKEIPVTQEQLNNWHNGTPIQDAMPNLSVDEREFILSGTTDEEWSVLVDGVEILSDEEIDRIDNSDSGVEYW